MGLMIRVIYVRGRHASDAAAALAKLPRSFPPLVGHKISHYSNIFVVHEGPWAVRDEIAVELMSLLAGE